MAAKSRKFAIVLSLCALSILSTHCTKLSEMFSPKNQGGGGAPANANEIVFGEYGSMTGSESTFGIATHKGIMMAVEEANKAGGIKGKQIRVVSLDDQGKADEAVTT